MGSTNFTTDVVPGAVMRAAYEAAVADAHDAHGRGAYNGSISTTSGCYQDVHRPMTRAGAQLHAQIHWDRASKWESALAVPVAADGCFDFRSEAFTLELPTTVEDGHPTTEHDLREAAWKAAAESFGESLHSVAVEPKVKTKLVVENGIGRPVTKYRVDGAGGYRRTQLHDTRAAAVAAVKAALSSGACSNRLTVEAVKVYPDTGSTAAATVRRVTVEATAKVTVTVAALKKPAPQTPVAGWVFFGIAAI